MSSLQHKFLVFSLDAGQFALPLDRVERVLPAAELTALPAAPDIILGVLNYRGRVLPAFDIRFRLRLATREMDLSDVLILARSRRRPMLLLADSVRGIEEVWPESIAPAQQVMPGLDYLRGVARGPEGLVLIQDLDAFLSVDEEDQLQDALYRKEERS